ncbi:hypothetical protein [Microcoleus vaginatus]|uniref:hypothetical protein n=1 Tax=Microcoleus vaginatus TaxID=119532 RepID=UPI001F6014FF
MLVKDLLREWERVFISLLVLLNNVMGKPVPTRLLRIVQTVDLYILISSLD